MKGRTKGGRKLLITRKSITSKLTVRNQIFKLKTSEGRVIGADETICEELNKNFYTAFINDTKEVPLLPAREGDDILKADE